MDKPIFGTCADAVRRRDAARRTLRRLGIGEGLLFVLPAVVVFGLFIIYPIIEVFRLSFFDWKGLETKNFVGLGNLRELLFEDRIFRIALRNNFYWVIVAIPLLLGLGLVLALALDTKIHLRNFYRTVFFMPATMAGVVIAAVWGWIYNPDFGLLNAFVEAIGLSGLARIWLGDPKIATFAVIAVHVWRWTGAIMVIYLSALQTIPQELLEAAVVDGANWWRKIWHVRLPLLLPTTGVLVVLGFIGAMREFELVYVLTRGGPAHASDTIALHIYNLAFPLFRPGYASALSAILLLLTLFLTVVQLRMYRRLAAM